MSFFAVRHESLCGDLCSKPWASDTYRRWYFSRPTAARVGHPSIPAWRTR
jgi:hypothetical protein